jgi:hypothetical protein
MSSEDPTKVNMSPGPSAPSGPAAAAAPSAPSAAPSTTISQGPTRLPTSVKGFFELLSEIIFIFIDKPMLKIAPEIGHLAPVILTVGSLFLSIITLNYPVFIFSLASAQATLLHSVISSTSAYFATPSSVDKTNTCKSYFQQMTPNRFSAFLKQGIVNTFPSTAMYFIAFASAYCIQCLSVFSEECTELGPAYSNRAYISILGAIMFIVLYALYLISYGCDSILTILGSVLMGGIVGSFICFQNYTLFGKQAVDLLFIPPLVKRSGMDYICVSTS